MYYKKLQSLNTFSINVKAKKIVTAHSELELLTLWNNAKKIKQPILILGGGSNILFLENYPGTIILNRIKGIKIYENQKSWKIQAKSGEIWHNIVKNSIKNNIHGLENMAMIPGYAGSAPIQNIGAYGIEFKEICEYVNVLELKTGKQQKLLVHECEFEYRNSIFQTKLKNNYAITEIGLLLKKNWKPILKHTSLKNLNTKNITPKKIYKKICKIRKKKLPNPKYLGNAGSFFKNPTIDIKNAKKLLKQHPKIPKQIQPNKKIKISASWLIELCGLKGYKLKNTAIYNKNALIIINRGKANGKEIAKLAKHIQKKVMKKFSIKLIPEVKYIKQMDKQ
ncbi:MAG: UDP-N-acetylenolpyruvoylglucosamine reductase [Candidatus Westeberhardia cardiocondylae]|nr:UDP-N-acetylenolpyruvoylglucosamine reductase [Candidatus Westeberhardia cardiocondylae]